MGFEAFSPAHWAALAVAAVVVAAIVLGRNRLRSPRANRAVRIGLAATLAGCEAALQASYAMAGEWGYEALPFQLCSIMVWLSAVLCFWRNRVLYEIVFFLGILGALQALLTPNLDETFPQFRYFHFFAGHIAIVAVPVLLTAVDGYRPNFRSALRALGWLHLLAIPAAITNAAVGTNFMFLARKPSTASLLDLLAPWPWYLLELELVAIALCLLLLAIVRLTDRVMKAKAHSKEVERT
ncbi:TIGR02206 family membrane protein [Cohnella faecalis]|uniref:TIGR02206 family membrane protein n=1 Tax=Cohnella faecalis TaxID=2315694 RepID=A0A398CDS7_9BACL|nr:TIGR02206 family membrane protein [Cohnella faecalis]RIE00790.1 TIGR02206 family membrane protein [Cohnella faecalis]